MDHLMASLLDILHELEGRGIAVLVGGGFGLYLKRQHLAKARQRMLFDELPEPRATNDLDLFLHVEVLANRDRVMQVKTVIQQLGYTPVKGAEFLQWEREVVIGGNPQRVKVDILVGPLGKSRSKLNLSPPRVRPKGESLEFHAHTVEEAIQIEDEPIAITLTGSRSNGEACTITALVPQAFPYVMMKLHAFADREAKGQIIKAQHHALDVYTIVGMMTEAEYERAKEIAVAHASDEPVQRARSIVREHFHGQPYGPPIPGAPWTLRSLEQGQYSQKPAIGLIRLREHELFREEFRLAEFTDVLYEVFGMG
jgi:hypothetical protein